MVSRICFVYMAFCLISILVVSIFLRDANSHMFYQLRICHGENERLKQQLWQKQLELEQLINPESVFERVSGSATRRP